jgi:hypothetical protein
MDEKAEPLPLEDLGANPDWETLDSRVSTAVPDIESALEEALAAIRDVAQCVERLRALSPFIRQVESGLMEVWQQLLAPPSGRPVASVARKVRAGARHVRVLEPAFGEPDTTEESLAAAVEALKREDSADTPEAIATTEADGLATAGIPALPSATDFKLLKQLKQLLGPGP